MSTETLTALPPLSLLVAYPYVTKGVYDLMAQFAGVGGVRWLLDSGAFTAWKSGQPISLDDYCSFLRNLPVQPWRYFALDVIGDGAASARNYYEMLHRGFKPVPVFTRGESLDVLDRYYETSDLVAIGGLVSRVSDPKPYIKHLHKHLGQRAYHLLGFTALDWIKYLKPYSVDSSSWEAAARYGTLCVYMGQGRIKNLSHREVRSHLHDESLAARIRALGFELPDLGRESNWHGGQSLARQITTASWMWLSIDVERRLGVRLFLARAHPSTFLPEAYARALRAAGLPVTELPTYKSRKTA